MKISSYCTFFAILMCSAQVSAMSADKPKKKEKEPEKITTPRELISLHERLEKTAESMLTLQPPADLKPEYTRAKILLDHLCDSLKEAITQQGKTVIFDPDPVRQYVQHHFKIVTPAELDKQLEEQKSALMEKYKKEAHTYQEKARAMIAALQEKNRTLEQEILALQETLSKPQQTLSQDKQELQRTIRTLEQEVTDLTKKLEGRAQELAEFRTHVATLECELDNAHDVPSEHISSTTALTLGTAAGAAALYAAQRLGPMALHTIQNYAKHR